MENIPIKKLTSVFMLWVKGKMQNIMEHKILCKYYADIM